METVSNDFFDYYTNPLATYLGDATCNITPGIANPNLEMILCGAKEPIIRHLCNPFNHT